MSRADRRRTAERIRHLLETEGDAVRANAGHFNERRYDAIREFDEYEALREEARAIKEAAIADLPALVETVTAAVEANGGSVHLAEDAADANRYVAEVAARHDAETLVKSKSMTTEEVGVNDHLAERGVDVYETDLGEFVIQVADESPSHIVGPAIHKSREDITRLFEAHFDPDQPLDSAEALTAFARDYLGERIREADVGMTGANFVLAESGTVVTVTNEGNARKCAVTPDVHVAVAGVEKLLPSVRELGPFVRLLARAATGQTVTQYLSLFSGPVPSPRLDFGDGADTPISEMRGDATDGESGDSAADGESDDPADGREFHLVLLDNGRTGMREDDQLRETLYCVRCGACSNACANFQAVGGHAFGGETYSGGIATGWEAGVEGLDSAAEFNDLCTGCSRCVPACPVKIDIPWVNTVVRDRVNREGDDSKFDFLVEGLTPDAEPGGLDRQKRFFGNAGTMLRLGSALAPASNWLANTAPSRWAMERWLGVDSRRALPEFRRETLVDWFEKRDGSRVPAAEADRRAVLYPDPYTNHVHVERGKAAVRVLEALGVHVRVPAVPESGRAPLSQGMVATAERQADRVHATLDDHLDAGRDVVVVEPSDLAMFRREYERLLPEVDFDRLADASYDVLEYVYGLLANGADAEDLGGADAEDPSARSKTVAYHAHCQQRTLGLETHTEAVLADLGFDVLTSDVECCGMAGSFGYKSQYYDLSVDVGEELAAQFDGEDARGRTVVASGTSCVEQLDGLLERPIRHPVELLDPGE